MTSPHRLSLYTQKAQLSLGRVDRTFYVSVRLLGAKKRFSRVTVVPYMLWWRCYIERCNQL